MLPESRATSVCFLSSMHPARDKRVFEKEARALAEAGCDVVHLCPIGPGESGGIEVVDGIRIRRLAVGRGLVGRAFALPRLVREAKREAADFYHCNEVDSWVAGIVAARMTGAKVVFDVHEHYPSAFGAAYLPRWTRGVSAALVRLLYRLLSPLTDGFVYAKASVAADFVVDEERTALVRNLPPLKLLDVSPIERTRPDEPAEVVAIHTGYMGRIRGWPELLDALSLSDTANVSCVLMGQFNDASEAEFHDRVDEMGLRDRISLEPWRPFVEAYERLLEADIGLILFQPGYQNHVFASPHKLFEYMLARLPVVAPDFAVEVVDIVEGYDCGILVDTSSPEAIAAALGELRSNPEMRRAMGTRGREAVLDTLNWESEVGNLYALYDRLNAGLQVG